MKDRILHIIKAESLTNLQFAQIVEISPASVTHLLAGRNNPSVEIIAKIAKRFPHYNLRWLILGEGSIYSSPAQTSIAQEQAGENEFAFDKVKEPTTAEVQQKQATQDNACKLIVCLPDGTYKEYTRQ